MSIFVFPGQGSQFLGMTSDFQDNFEIAKTTFEEIESYTSINIRKIILENENNLLNITNFTQICIFAASVAIFRTLEQEKKIDIQEDSVFLGHSLGEYTALACSKKMNLKDASLILKKRGELMNDAVKPNTTGMAALLGCDSNFIESLIVDNSLNLQIANDNSPIQVVVSGSIEEIQKSNNFFLKNNVKKFIILNVSSAFHSTYMIEAQNELNDYLKNFNLSNNNFRIISNYSAKISNDNIVILNSLKNQMANRVRWTESIQTLEKIGKKNIIEIGPGKVLSGLIKRISKNFDIKSYEKVSDLG